MKKNNKKCFFSLFLMALVTMPPLLSQTSTLLDTNRVKEFMFLDGVLPGSAGLSWYTGSPTTYTIQYGLQKENTVQSDSLRTDHFVDFQNLLPGHKYYFTLSVTDGEGNTAIAVDSSFETAGTSQGYYHTMLTGGYDYGFEQIYDNPAEQEWLALHHDMIVGIPANISSTIYQRLKNANPDVILVTYIAYNTMMPEMSSWMEDWCTNNGHDPEDLYYHYYYDTDQFLRNNTTITVPGYGGGTASSLSEARVKAAFHGGQYPNICPSSPTFRDAYKAYALEMLKVQGMDSTWVDGLFMDSFEGTVVTQNHLHLENTIEMRELGLDDSTAAINAARKHLIESEQEIYEYLSRNTGKTFITHPNAADVDNIFHWEKELYADYMDEYTMLSVEFLITSGFCSTFRIPRLIEVYDAMEEGHKFFINSQTNYAVDVPIEFVRFVLANHYLINHPNGYFSYHMGGPGMYGPIDGSFQQSHWHKNLEYNLGRPVTRASEDYWEETNTNRFFSLFDSSYHMKVLAREYEKGLVVAKFTDLGGWDNIGIEPATYALNGNYHLLLEDNTLGPVITEITLGNMQGAILIKQTAASDTTPPSFTPNLNASIASNSQVNLSWNASADNNLKGYRIYRNNIEIADITSTSYADTGLAFGTTYNYYVTAYDSVGNECQPTDPASVTLPYVFFDCNNVEDGTAYIDNCGHCVGGNTGEEPCEVNSIEVHNKQSVNIYPIPTFDVIHIQAATNIQSLAIYDMTGKAVEKITLNTKMLSLNISNLDKGLYLIKIQELNGKVSTRKIIKE